MTHLISEVFKDTVSAEQAYRETLNMGYDPSEINLVMSEETKQHFHDDGYETDVDHNAQTAKEVLKGAAIGGGIGASFGILTALGTNAIMPGIGMIIAGPLMSGIASASAGALAGGLVKALEPHGIDELDAQKYEQEIHDGGVMIAVNPKNNNENLLRSKWQSIKQHELVQSYQ